MDVLVAAAADHQGLAAPHGHQAYPCRCFASARLVEIGEFADVVDLQAHRARADLAAFGQQPVDQLVAPVAGQDWPLVGDALYHVPACLQGGPAITARAALPELRKWMRPDLHPTTPKLGAGVTPIRVTP